MFSRHARDSSYDSYEKESVDSLEDQLDGSNMPMTRYNSGSALNRNHPHFSTFDSSYSDDKQSSVYRSSPDLSHGNISHRRYSSTDSVDSSQHSSHSRQGSESNDTGYPTRRITTQLSRKSSTSADPLQFIKGKGAVELAHTAEVQMRVASECKKVPVQSSRSVNDDDAEWQANLSSWKSRRKSHSERSYALREELEAMEKEKDEAAGSAIPAKTFSQMQEERTRRQSLPNRKFYPIEDDEDDQAFISSSSEKKGFSQSMSSKENRAPWASHDEEEKDRNNAQEKIECNSSNSLLNSGPTEDHDSNNNNGLPSSSKTSREEERPFTRSSSRSKLMDRYRDMDSEDNDTSLIKKTMTPDSGSSRTRRSGVLSISDKKDSDQIEFSRSANTDSTSWKSQSKNSSFDKARDAFNKNDSVNKDGSSGGSSVRATHNVGPRNQNKIGSILRNFEQSESKSTMPKQGYNEKIDLGDRRRMFEKPSVDTGDVRPASGFSSSRKFDGSSGRSSDEISGDSDYTSSDERKSSRDSREYRNLADSGDFSSKYGSANVSVDSGMKDYSTNGDSARDFPSSRKDTLETPKASADNADESLDEPVDSFSRSDYHSATPSSMSSSSLVGPAAAAGNVYASARSTDKDFVEKTIRISQKANSDRGFGFILTGGADKGEPLTVSKVNLGSAADVCELHTKDQVLAVNQRDVSTLNSMEVGDLVAQAVVAGYIELRVKRELGDDDEEEEDFSDSSSDEGEEDISSPQTHTKEQREEPSIQSQLDEEREWLEHQIFDAEEDLVQQERTPIEMGDPGSPAVLQETLPGHHIEVQNRQTITLSRPQDTKVSKQDELDCSSPVSIGHSPSSSQVLEDDSDGSSGPGPPAILRKWQRQRQKDEYTFDAGSDPSTTSPLYRKISLNASLPKRDFDDEQSTGQSTVQSRLATRLTKPWDERQDEWTLQQDQRRQPDNAEPWNRDAGSEQAQFEAERDRIHQQYTSDLRAAERKENERQQQEQEQLKPELDKARLLEERRAERRARIQKEATGATSTPPPSQPSIESSGGVNGTASGGNQETHVSSMQLNIAQSQPARSNDFYSQPLNSGPSNVIVIDPKNRQNQIEPGVPIEFQVKVGQSDFNKAALLEAERQRIRQEELLKIEEGRRKVEEEMRAREEELRKIREKEQLLKKQEELLRQQREQFLREQEEFRRKQEQQIQHQQQLQQQQQQPQQNYHLQQQTNQDPAQVKDLSNRYSPQRAPSPYAPVPFHPPRTTSPVRSASSQYSTPAYPASSSTQYQPYQNMRGAQSTQAQPWSNTDSQHPSSHLQTNRLPPSDSKGSNNLNNGDVRSGKRFSWDEMLAMNRQATPLQSSQPQNQENHKDSALYQQTMAPISREPMTRENMSSINFAPKAKLRDDSGWYGQNQNASKSRNSSRPQDSPIQQYRNQQPPCEAAKQRGGSKFSFAGSGDHWLVQEAERRRLAESEGRLNPSKASHRSHSPSSQFSGPIKPAADAHNRWRENNGHQEDPNVMGSEYPSPSMPAIIRQTLLHKTATARGPEQLSPHGQYPPTSTSPSNVSPHPDNYPYHREASPQPPRGSPYQQQQQQQTPSQKCHQPPSHHQQQPYYPDLPKQSRYPPGPPSGPAPPLPGETDTAISGSQLCSQCNQELGFGAAMIIESLNLYFHVQCFRCYVCHASLGTGSQGADVRVRMNKLHCPNCYSNDEAGLKFSKV